MKKQLTEFIQPPEGSRGEQSGQDSTVLSDIQELRGATAEIVAQSRLVERSERTLSPEQKEQLLSTLKARFKENMDPHKSILRAKHHKGIGWAKVEDRLNKASPEKLWSLNEMERTGGEPDVVGYIEKTGEFEFYDCSKESPEGRRNICYDREGQEKVERNGCKPAGNAEDMAEAMGLGGILNRDQYKNKLQKFGKFDRETWSWIDTPEEKRKQGVALFAGMNYDVVYVDELIPHHFSGVRAFRGWLMV